MKTKICTKCYVKKDIANFYKQKCGKFSVTSICKLCAKEYKKTKIYKKSQQKSNKKYYTKNKKEINKERRNQYLKPEIRKKILKYVSKYRKLPEHKRKAKIYMRNYQVKKYGITLDQYNQILQKQKCLCVICLQPETLVDSKSKKVRRLCVDHNHLTGKVRGLLCDKCNRGLGNFQDNTAILSMATNYLILHRN
jgi:hypothetical protein